MQDSILAFFNSSLPAKTAQPSVAQQQEELIKTFQQVTIPQRSVEVKAPQDSTANALPMLQKAIDALAQQGGGKVIVNKGLYYLCGALNMRSNIELNLAKGAVLKFSGKAFDFLPVVQTRWEGTELQGRSAMIYANGCENIAITGKGTIDAQGGKEMARWGMKADTEQFEENAHGTHGETVEMPDVRRLRTMGGDASTLAERVFGEGTFLRPCAIEFYACSKVLLDGITLKNSPFWCIHPVYSDNVTVRNVTIDSHYPNNDGCDPESSRNVLIENCTFRTGDDAIAIKAGRDADGRRVGRPSENIVIRHCKFYSECNGLCIGSEMSGGVRNVLMYDVEIGNVKNALLFKSNLDRGGYIRDVAVDKININSVKGAVLRFETNYFGYRGGNYPAQYERFRISNVTAGNAEGYGIYYDGPCYQDVKRTDYPIRDILVSDFNVKSATYAYYLYNTDRCRFERCTVGNTTIPEYPQESKERQSCDVW
ncbi:MAG: glycoside hydrolase family 28 protein [Prevotella sp.]|nr:glycoside hydrolase family 28 protein [Candidatus Prevotella equi]